MSIFTPGSQVKAAQASISLELMLYMHISKVMFAGALLVFYLFISGFITFSFCLALAELIPSTCEVKGIGKRSMAHSQKHWLLFSC